MAMIRRHEVCRGFGELLKQRRSAANLSQKDFAKALGVSRTSITNIECGRQPVSLPCLYVMADILQVDVSELLPPIKSRTAARPAAVARLKNVTSKESNWLSKLVKSRANAKD